MFLKLSQWMSHGIVIGPLNEAGENPVEQALQLTPERVALELCVGNSFERDHRAERLEDGDIRIKKGECVRIRLREWISVPDNVFGLVCGRASYAADGLAVSTIKVDPCYTGNLLVTVFNGGPRPITLKRGMAFCCLFFGELHPLEDEATPRWSTPTARVQVTNKKEKIVRHLHGPWAPLWSATAGAAFVELIRWLVG